MRSLAFACIVFAVTISAAAIPQDDSHIVPNNVIDVPVVCPPGQQVDNNGRCRPIWRITMAEMKVLVQRYVKCLEEYADVADHVCRPEWQLSTQGSISPAYVGGGVEQKNVIDVPITCPKGQKPDNQGRCRTIYRLPNEWSV